MDTKVWKIDQITRETDPAIEEASALLDKNQVVAFPTETVYGLGANAKEADAVDKIFRAKGRPSDNPLIVHIADRNQVDDYVAEVPEVAEKLLSSFTPGPLTLILKSNGTIAENVTAGLPSIGVRIPDHPVAQALLRACRLPLAAPSANKSGRPSPTTAEHVYDDLQGKIAGLLDGGSTGVGVESTVVDCTGEMPIILRPGGVTREQLEEVVGSVMIDPALASDRGELPEDGAVDKPRAPGMKYTHYAPDAPMWLVDGDPAFMQAQIDAHLQAGDKVGVIASEELAAELNADHVNVCGSRDNLNEVAAHLYDALRSFKKSDVDIILCETFPETGVGQAIMNRLQKAATKKINQL
ncbi:threonylcarbamoyl-AMP synthase [Sediminibacillus dalangtanensis]|uniref:Threonylcarbamoyl-AMP synthase n=1 Tax=Sediminibacillus dalangtanensis TaxID=2729421 RepID=A0ABX7VYC8_9BACI|nr:L-threonylcarbamoyladenylate synthase [Sediminibacillus dalangtanensis]QTN01614.1 threonylcarbamoyl-AMP synthase [Sediminibacillus dalangtanensis]